MKNYLLYIVVGCFSLILLVRLFYLQVLNPSEVSKISSRVDVKTIKTKAFRGRIFDRSHRLLVGNFFYYDLMVTPVKIASLDTVAFCKLIGIDKKTFLKKLKEKRPYRTSSIFISRFSKDKYAYMQEQIHRFKGFAFLKKVDRYYPYKNAAHIFGYVGELKETRNEIGITGLEKYYEKNLRGKNGIQYKQRNKFGQIIEDYKQGKYDHPQIDGKDLEISIDIVLQEYLERLMQNKRGAIVAIEPRTGEILSLVTAPTYSPDLMIGKNRENSAAILQDTLNKPLFNRALLAQYAPGSVFKIIAALISLQEGVIEEKTKFKCYGGYKYGRGTSSFMHCHCGAYAQNIALKRAIFKSCNSYFCNVYKKILHKYASVAEGLDIWSQHVKSFGWGNYLGYDLPQGKKGLVPDSHLYDNWYSQNKWRWTYTISNAIGQGQLLTTPIQLANLAAIVANRGYYYTPHILKNIEGKKITNPKYIVKKKTSIAPKHFTPVVAAMAEVFKSGTARYSALKNIEICGKTGTVENFSIVDGEKVQHEDHSVFIAFAPRNNPKIALAIYIENGGFGSEIAAPIASLAVEKYLTGKTNPYREQMILNKNLYERYVKQANLKP